MMSDAMPPRFEDNMEALDRLVEKMERGEFSLEQALEAFEEGSRLVKRCRDQLMNAEMRVEKIMNSMGDTVPLTVPEAV